LSASSSTGGYLQAAVNNAPLDDDDLVNFFQEWVVGLSGIDGSKVRPRWQPEATNIPDQNVNWLALGITISSADTYVAEVHNNAGAGYNEMRRHETLTVKTSFYGPKCSGTARRFRDAMQIAQNREVLSLNSMGLIESGDIVAAPELVKEKWYLRADLEFTIRRQVVRTYPISSLTGLQITLNNEHYSTQIVK